MVNYWVIDDTGLPAHRKYRSKKKAKEVMKKLNKRYKIKPYFIVEKS